MRHGRQVQGRIGRSTGRRHDHSGIFKGLEGADIARAKIALNQGHNRLARRHRIGIAAFIRGRQGGRQRQGKANRFGHAGHGIGGKLTPARPIAGAGMAFKLAQGLKAHPTSRMLTHAFEHVEHGDILALPAARQDGAAIEKHAGDIEAQHGHHHARQALVTPGHPNQGIIAVAANG